MPGGYSRNGRTTNASLTEKDVRFIRSSFERGDFTARELARKYGVGTESIRRIIRWDTWTWVSEEGEGYVAPKKIEFSPEEIKASQERFLRMLERGEGGENPFVTRGEDEPSGAGMERLAQEIEKASAGNRLLESLTEKPVPDEGEKK